MKILAFESTAKACSVALCEDDFLIAQSYQNSGLTHSTTLMPMAQDLLRNCGMKLSDVDCLAVAIGPGSFTGLRIGISTVKGLAWGGNIPCVGVSTLEAMAWNLAHMEGETVCCAMDARRKQVYNALFSIQNGKPVRLCPDRAISLEELAVERGGDRHILVGDGAVLCYNNASQSGGSVVLAPQHLRYQSGWGVAQAALERCRRGETVSGAELEANYLRLSQAERERMEKEKSKG